MKLSAHNYSLEKSLEKSLSHAMRRAVCGAVSALLLTSTAFATPCPPEEELAPVDLGNLPMTFAETEGGFTGTGIGGRVSYAGSTIELQTAEIDGVIGSSTLAVRFSGAKSAAPAFGKNRSAAQLTVLGKRGSQTLTAYQAVQQSELYGGVDLSVSASQRRLDLDLRGSSEALSQVRFELPNAREVAIHDGGGELRVGLGNSRTLTVELVALATADGRETRLGGKFVDLGSGAIGIEIEDTAAPARVLLTTLFSPYQEAIATPPGRDGSRLAVANVPGLRGHQQVMVTALSKDGGKVRSTTLIDLGQDLEIHDATVGSDGHLLLAGSRSEGRESSAFLASFDPERQTLTQSAAFGSLVEGTVHGLAVTGEGQVVATGIAERGFVSFNRQAARFTLVSPAERDGEPRRLFVAQLDPTLSRLTWATELEAALAPQALQARIDCKDELLIGLPFEPKALLMVDHTYSMSLPSSAMVGCPLIDDGWGYGAMCWKWQHGVPNWDYTPNNVDAQFFPNLLVANPDPPFDPDFRRLNRLEANQPGNLFFDPDANAWKNPGGDWNGPDNWAFSKAEIAVAGAIYHSRWDSPVFTNFRLDDGTNPPAPVAVMMRSETFSADSQSEMPHNVCNEDTDGDGHSDFSDDPYPLPPEHQVAAACVDAHGSQFELKSIDYDTWLLGSYVPDETVQASDNSWWPFFGPYVGDPPVPGTDGASDLHVREMSRRLRRQARVSADLKLTTVEAGIVQAETELCAQVALMDLEAASE